MRQGLGQGSHWWWVAVPVLLLVGFGVATRIDLASATPHRHGRARFVASLSPLHGGGSARPADLTRDGRHWVSVWAASPAAPTPQTIGAKGFDNQTVRNVVFTSAGGSMVRVLVTNVFGTRPLLVGQAAVGIWDGGADVADNHPLTFGGRTSKVIPAGAAAMSDPVSLQVPPLQRLVISLFLPRYTGPATQHVLAQQTNYVATGDHALDGGGSAYVTHEPSWYFIASVDTLATRRDRGAIVAIGDSITDGVASGMNLNARWPNDLARRFAAHSGPVLSVVDEGIGGNRILHTSPCCGVSAVARFGRDVLRRTGVRDVILLEGINDIGFSQSHGVLNAPHTNVSAQQIISGYRRIIAEAHRVGLRIFGATLTPFLGARYWSGAGEAKRDAINHWILTSHAFDGVINFAKAVADPGDPLMLNPAYDSGDHLHPNRAGYRAMANAVSLAMLLKAATSRT
jgi:lysophospholipase L1-like esterase